jgi:glucose-1-phosphate cytidylyltransferase
VDVAILAGGRSTRFTAAADSPKALAEVGNATLLDHVIARFARAGHRRVVIALGHHREAILDHFRREGTLVGAGEDHVDLRRHDVQLRLVDTGLPTGTGGRVARLRPHLPDVFQLAWCDGLTDLPPVLLTRHHRRMGRRVTVAAVHPPTRFGRLELDGDAVTGFEEKPHLGEVWVSAGLFVVDASALDHVVGDDSSWERDVLPRLTKDGDLAALRYEGFWATVDTPEDLARMRDLALDACPPWESTS